MCFVFSSRRSRSDSAPSVACCCHCAEKPFQIAPTCTAGCHLSHSFFFFIILSQSFPIFFFPAKVRLEVGEFLRERVSLSSIKSAKKKKSSVTPLFSFVISVSSSSCFFFAGRWRHQGDQHHPRGQGGLGEGRRLPVRAAQGARTGILRQGRPTPPHWVCPSCASSVCLRAPPLLLQVFLVRKVTPPDANQLYAMKVLKKATLKGPSHFRSSAGCLVSKRST